MSDKKIKEITILVVLTALAIAASVVALRATGTALGLFVLALVVLLVVLDPLVGLVCYIAFVYVRPNELVPILYSLRVFVVTLGATFLSMLVRKAVLSRSLELTKGPQDYILAWLVVAIGLSHLSHGQVGGAFSAVWDMVPNVVLYFLIINLVTTYQRMTIVLLTIVASTVFVVGQALLQHFVGFGVGGLTRALPDKVDTGMTVAMAQGRLVAFGQSVDANVLALTVLVALPFVFLGLRKGAGVAKKLVSLAIALVFVYAIYLTNSRGGVLSLAVLVGLFVTARWGPLLGVPLTIVAIVAAIMFGPSRMMELGPESEGRVELWEEGFRLFGTSPVFGIGKGGWNQQSELMIAHNSFIHGAAELGLFGLIPWVLLIYLAFKNLRAVLHMGVGQEFGRRRSFARALLFSLLGFVLPAIFLSMTYNYLLFILLGLSAAAADVCGIESGWARRSVKRTDLAVACGIVLFGLVGFRVFLLIVR